MDPVLEAQKAAYRYGLTPEQFWSLTPQETRTWRNARIKAEKEEHRGRVFLAWHIAIWSRAKKVPSWEGLMRQISGEVAKQQTPEEMLKVAEAMTIALGGKDLRKTTQKEEEE